MDRMGAGSGINSNPWLRPVNSNDSKLLVYVVFGPQTFFFAIFLIIRKNLLNIGFNVVKCNDILFACQNIRRFILRYFMHDIGNKQTIKKIEEQCVIIYKGLILCKQKKHSKECSMGHIAQCWVLNPHQ